MQWLFVDADATNKDIRDYFPDYQGQIKLVNVAERAKAIAFADVVAQAPASMTLIVALGAGDGAGGHISSAVGTLAGSRARKLVWVMKDTPLSVGQLAPTMRQLGDQIDEVIVLANLAEMDTLAPFVLWRDSEIRGELRESGKMREFTMPYLDDSLGKRCEKTSRTPGSFARGGDAFSKVGDHFFGHTSTLLLKAWNQDMREVLATAGLAAGDFVFVSGSKGGVGKSWAARSIIDYYVDGPFKADRPLPRRLGPPAEAVVSDDDLAAIAALFPTNAAE